VLTHVLSTGIYSTPKKKKTKKKTVSHILSRLSSVLQTMTVRCGCNYHPDGSRSTRRQGEEPAAMVISASSASPQIKDTSPPCDIFDNDVSATKFCGNSTKYSYFSDKIHTVVITHRRATSAPHTPQ
jgi:hypothetical protein